MNSRYQTMAGMNSSLTTNGTYYITEAYPSLKEPTSLINFVASIYLFCFVIGICGNASTLTLIFGFGQRHKTAPKLGQATHDRFKVYVASLCFTDILMLLSLPSDIRKGGAHVLVRIEAGNCHIVHVRIFKCVDSMPSNLLFWFTGSTFFVGYFCPIILISTFNIKLLLEIRRHQRKLKKSIIPTKRVTIYIVIIALFYFLCWSPYWTSVLYVSYVDIFESRAIKTLTNSSERTILLIYCAHILPYLSTSINWFLYGRLARNLTSQQSSSMMLYRNGAAETTSFTKHLVDNNTQSEFSWTRKQTLEEGSLLFGAAPAHHHFVRSLQSNSVELKMANGRHASNHDDSSIQRPLTKYEEEIESFETL
ncbi:G-PROTEIN-RECEP-F1-2 domain-containing protein [Aphelenchoides bicaudatus]|nr:G-PROTEIN-RECEP-F1-2 domain-containing protein [Aphelenchoides bicaudatus]